MVFVVIVRDLGIRSTCNGQEREKGGDGVVLVDRTGVAVLRVLSRDNDERGGGGGGSRRRLWWCRAINTPTGPQPTTHLYLSSFERVLQLTHRALALGHTCVTPAATSAACLPRSPTISSLQSPATPSRAFLPRRSYNCFARAIAVDTVHRRALVSPQLVLEPALSYLSSPTNLCIEPCASHHQHSTSVTPPNRAQLLCTFCVTSHQSHHVFVLLKLSPRYRMKSAMGPWRLALQQLHSLLQRPLFVNVENLPRVVKLCCGVVKSLLQRGPRSVFVVPAV